MMKIKLLLMVLITGSLGFISCDDGGKVPPVKTLSVSPESLSFDSSISTQHIDVTANGLLWGVSITSANSSWLSAVKEGERIVVSTTEINPNADSRFAIITVESESSNGPVSIQVTQLGSGKLGLTLNPESLTFDGSGNTPQEVAVTTTIPSTEWSVDANADWITVTKGTDKITVNVSDNSDMSPRTGSITFTSKHLEQNVELAVTQLGSGKLGLTLNPESLTFDGIDNTPREVAVTTTIPSTEWSVDANADWITVTKGTDKITVNVSDNSDMSPRTGSITFTSKHLEQNVELAVTQQGAPETITYDTANGTYFANIDNTGTGNFVIDLHSSSDDMVGLLIDGYSDLIDDASAFFVKTGKYSVSETSGAVNTLIKGAISEQGSLLGTSAYNFNEFKYTLCQTGTTVDVVYTAGIYDITAKISGVDLDGNAMPNLIIKYSGPISFLDDRRPIEQMPVGSYKFDATPKGSGLSTWNAGMEKNYEENFLKFAGFANQPGIPLFVDYVHEEEGSIVRSFLPDTYTNYGEQGGEIVSSGMRYCILIGESTSLFGKGESIFGKWDNDTQILTFGDATYALDGTDYDLMLGLFGFNAEGKAIATFSDYYKTMTAKYAPIARSNAGYVSKYTYPKLAKANLAATVSSKSEKKVNMPIELTPINDKRYQSLKTIEFDPSKVKLKR